MRTASLGFGDAGAIAPAPPPLFARPAVRQDGTVSACALGLQGGPVAASSACVSVERASGSREKFVGKSRSIQDGKNLGLPQPCPERVESEIPLMDVIRSWAEGIRKPRVPNQPQFDLRLKKPPDRDSL